MRINAGTHKGRQISAPKGKTTRPTSDRAREAIFNVLAHGLDGPGLNGARVADLFAGTGAFGLEALSRGAAFAVFVENAPAALDALDENIRTLKETDRTGVLKMSVERLGPPPGGVPEGAFDVVFLDPPYAQGLTLPALEKLTAHGWLKDGALVVAEVAAKEALSPPAGFKIQKEKTFGAARAVFLSFTAHP